MPKFHPLTVSDVRRETADAVSIAFDVPGDLKESYLFTPGQYLTLKADLGGEEVRRSYSICSAAGEGELRVAVKRVDKGVFSRFANDDVAVGDTIDVMEPDGRFTVQPGGGGRNIVAFAAGSGITPVMSIVKSVLRDEPESTVTLFYGNRSVQGILFREALEDLKNRYHQRFTLQHVLSGEVQEAPLFNGRLDKDKAGRLLDALVQTDNVDAFLICGPGNMTEAVTDALRDRGVSEDRIRFELFTPAGMARAGTKPTPVQVASALESDNPALEDGEADVTVILDGVQTQFGLGRAGDSIMAAARNAGADAPFSCTGGVCATCRARLVEGEVTMDANFALSEEELAQGYVLTCQSHPTTRRVTVDYDGAV